MTTEPTVATMDPDDVRHLLRCGANLADATDAVCDRAEAAVELLQAYAATLPERERWRVEDACRELTDAVDALDEERKHWDWTSIDVEDELADLEKALARSD